MRQAAMGMQPDRTHIAGVDRDGVAKSGATLIVSLSHDGGEVVLEEEVDREVLVPLGVVHHLHLVGTRSGNLSLA